MTILTDTLSGVPASGSEAVSKPLLRPAAILLHKYQINIYIFHLFLVLNKKFKNEHSVLFFVKKKYIDNFIQAPCIV